MPARDDYTQRNRPYPSDAPALVTDWNPACLCSHAQFLHECDYATDTGVSWGRCKVPTCPCNRFRDECFGDEE